MSSESVETRRLFLALWPSEQERRAIAEIAGTLPGGHPVCMENLHLTLVFLGATTDQQRVCYEEALRGIEAPSLTLELDRIGYWPRSRILWLGASRTPSTLLALVVELNRRLQGCGFRPETRPFKSHLTLARKYPGPVSDGRLFDPVSWPVDHFALCESVNQRHGVHYKVLRRWPEARG